MLGQTTFAMSASILRERTDCQIPRDPYLMLCRRKRLIWKFKRHQNPWQVFIYLYKHDVLVFASDGQLMLCLVLQHQSPLTHTLYPSIFSTCKRHQLECFTYRNFRLIKFSYEQVTYENFLILKFYVRIILCTKITRFTVCTLLNRLPSQSAL